MAKTALTEREKRIWRAGLVRGAELALEATERLRDRVRFRGIKADPPDSFGERHLLEPRDDEEAA